MEDQFTNVNVPRIATENIKRLVGVSIRWAEQQEINRRIAEKQFKVANGPVDLEVKNVASST